MKAQILLVEDNPLTAKGLKYLLEREQYQVIHAANLQAARRQLQAQTYDLVLLDVALPDGDGFALAESMQGNHQSAPVIFITARDDETDVVRGLELGAADYITKPFRNRELLLRIRNHLRRREQLPTQITVGPITYDPDGLTVTVAGEIIALSALEQKLLLCFLENPGHIIPRQRLLDEIYDASGSIVNDNTLSVYLKRLRAKLGLPRAIETVKNLGYRLRVPTEETSP